MPHKDREARLACKRDGYQRNLDAKRGQAVEGYHDRKLRKADAAKAKREALVRTLPRLTLTQERAIAKHRKSLIEFITRKAA